MRVHRFGDSQGSASALVVLSMLCAAYVIATSVSEAFAYAHDLSIAGACGTVRHMLWVSLINEKPVALTVPLLGWYFSWREGNGHGAAIVRFASVLAVSVWATVVSVVSLS
jgi:hypothetical protein